MILVIGGTGFIGKHMVKALHDRGQDVTVVSRRPDAIFLSRHCETSRAVTIEYFLAAPDALVAQASAIVYLANTLSPGDALAAPWLELSTNLDPLFKCVLAAARSSGTHFVYLSSGGAIYGQSDVLHPVETTPPAPISPYGLGKQMAEDLVRFVARRDGLSATILRPTNPIGIWQDNIRQGIVAAMMRAARDQTPLTVFGDGSSERNYFDVRDLASAIIASIDRPTVSVGKTWNVGTETSHSIRTMIDEVNAVTGRTFPTNHVAARPGDPLRSLPDCGAIIRKLGWQPDHPMRDCLTEMWAYANG